MSQKMAQDTVHQTVTRSETQGKDGKGVLSCLKLRSPHPRKSAPPASVLTCWLYRNAIMKGQLVHSSKNAVKHSQTRGPKDTIKSNMDDVYRLKHVETQKEFLDRQGTGAPGDEDNGAFVVKANMESMMTCCHLLPCVAIG